MRSCYFYLFICLFYLLICLLLIMYAILQDLDHRYIIISSSHMNIKTYKNLRIYKSLTGFQLLNALLVNRIASIKPLVNNAQFIYNTSTKLFGIKFTNKLIQRTFGKIFSSGESQKEVAEDMKKFQKQKISALIGYCGEGFLNRKGEEKQMDYNVQKLLKAAQIGIMYPNQVLPIKISSLTQVKTLKRVNQGRQIINTFISKFASHERINQNQMLESFKKLDESINKQDVNAFIRQLLLPNNQSLESFSCDQIYFLMKVHPYYYFDHHKNNNNLLRLLCPLEQQDQRNLQKLNLRLQKIIEPFRNNNSNLKITIDAQQSYIQSAIDSLTEQYQQVYNKDKSYLLPTLQNYLKDAKRRIQYQIEIAHRRNLYFAMKIVRGAYMMEENKLAKEKYYESPICETFQDTSKNYLQCVDKCLKDSRIKQNSQIIAAGHNQQTIKQIKQMLKLNHRSKLTFAQLKGIGDHLTYLLAIQGYPVLKNLAYGNIDIMSAYLIRRAQQISHTTYPLKLQYQLIKDQMKQRFQNYK